MKPDEDRTFLTLEEYMRIPDDGWRHSLQAGLLIAEPQSFARHGQLQVRIAHLLSEFVNAHRLGVVLSESGFLLSRNPDTVLGPDVSFVRSDRFDADEAARGYIRGAPDLAIEILSPSNRPGDTHARVADYLAAGAALVWVVDPKLQIVTTYRSLLAPQRVDFDGVLDGEDVLPGFSIPVATILER
jgi:Uma2 family endonuclease